MRHLLVALHVTRIAKSPPTGTRVHRLYAHVHAARSCLPGLVRRRPAVCPEVGLGAGVGVWWGGCGGGGGGGWGGGGGERAGEREGGGGVLTLWL